MDIETSQLKASELGKVVLFYTKHTKLDPSIKRAADQLVSKCTRCYPLSSAPSVDGFTKWDGCGQSSAAPLSCGTAISNVQRMPRLFAPSLDRVFCLLPHGTKPSCQDGMLLYLKLFLEPTLSLLLVGSMWMLIQPQETISDSRVRSLIEHA